ncbi:DUF3696 domain-containing protein [Enterobacter sp. AD2-3]|uniref:AAA family ATPase n=1 Tax=Enterobacter sp. AD2-3 TaxID=2547834 RepID=UPI00109DA7B0|nr:AAA family ATPase [Enterobacter sp. AD2-3]THC27733.1 DUF3696 domain-containing protein [Enterobacter sp. AD2-3]
MQINYTQDEDVMRLSVEGYKSIAQKRSIEVKGLTIIAGANSSGKSSFMQPFLILKQTLENNTDDSTLVINGENTNLTESSQIFCNITKKEEFSIYIEYHKDKRETGLKEESKATFSYDKNNGFTISESSLKSAGKEIKITPRMNQDEISEMVSIFRKNDKQFDNVYKNFDKSDFIMDHKISNDKPFLSLDIKPRKVKEQQNINFGIGFGFNPNGALEDLAKKIIHIPGVRSTPERQYKIQGFNKRYQGRFDKYTASILYKWNAKDKSKIKELNNIINSLGLGGDISTKKINEAQVCIEMSLTSKYKNSKDKVNVSDVGFGLSQILPIIVAVIQANNDHIIYIEQPEIHLHPKAQFKLATVLSDYANKGKKMIIETHSSIFIRGLQIEVAEGRLSKDSVSLNWFTQDSDGATVVSEAMFDDNGTFGDWPSDFDETYLEVESKYLDAVEKNLGLNN